MVLLECAAAATAATAATAAPSTSATVALIAPIATAMAMSEKWGETEVAYMPWYKVAWHVVETIYEDVSETLGIEPWRTQERRAWLAEEAAAREEYEEMQRQERLRLQILQTPTPHGRRGRV